MPSWLSILPYPLQLTFLILVGWVSRLQQEVIDYLEEENKILREQLGTKRLRLSDAQRRRLATKGERLGRKKLSEVCQIVTADTILRWYRRLVAKRYDGSTQRGVGRPRTSAEVAELVLQVARENPTFGYTRIRDVLKNLGLKVSRSTVRRILQEHGVEPAPERGQRVSWKDFLATNWDGIAGADFFSAEVMTWGGIVRYSVFFVIDLSTRRVQIAGVSADPTGAWVEQLGRNLTDPFDGFLRGMRFLILDRDPL